ncbi:MAG: LysM peptidoglycan-binding domain-containing protein [Bacteroidia bacterium]
MKYFVWSFLMFCQLMLQAQTYLAEIDYSRVHYYKLASGYVEPSAQNGVVLTETQKNTLLSVLNNKSTHTGARMRCFEPHDEFIFYNAQNEEVGHIIIALECNAMIAEPLIPSMQSVKNPGISKTGAIKLKNLMAEISKTIPVQKPKPVEALTYTVKKGEKLTDLAKKFSTSVAMIQTLNPNILTKSNLANETLQIKKNTHSLQYPPLKAVNVSSKNAILPEETVSASVSELRIKASKSSPNNVNARDLKPETAAGAAGPKATKMHIVQKGDTLYSIARNNGISVESLLKINNLSSANIGVGQKLKLKS